MKICADCFNDEEIKNYILSNGNFGRCDVFSIDTQVLELDELSDFFSDLLNIFKTKIDSNYSIYDYIQKDWSLFSSKKVAEKIIDECISTFGNSIDKYHVVYIDNISNYVSIWKKMKYDLQYKSRFFINLNSYNPNDPYLQNCINVENVLTTLSSGTILYRARILPDKVSYYKKENLGCPPPETVNNGRANPIGIPYLYLCNDMETTFYEVRARFKDRVSVGDFKIKRDLTIVSLTSLSSLYLSSHSGDFVTDVKHKLLLNDIAKDMSKPLSRYDTELDYVPTQFICELCKINGADGISFKSSLNENGINYVLFDANDINVAECIKVRNITIEHVEIRQ